MPEETPPPTPPISADSAGPLPSRVAILVVGAGPAGLMAARALKERGAEFLVIDKKEKIGEPLACGEGILLHELTGLNLDFDPREFGTLSTRQLFVYGGVRKRFSIDTFELDRPRFERRLAEPVSREIRLRTRALEVREEDDAVLVRTPGGIVRAGIAILAKGPDNLLPRKLGMMSRKHDLVVAYGGRFEGCRIPDLTWSIELLDGLDTLNYFWIFPSSPTRANVGLGYLNRPNLRINLRREFERIVAGHPALAGARMTRALGGSIPVSGPLDRTYTARILACGDFAGHVGALGDGIYYAMAGGRHAGHVAADAIERGLGGEEALAPYEAHWRATFGAPMAAGLAFRNLLDRTLRAGIARPLIRLLPAPVAPAILFQGRLRRTLGWLDRALPRRSP